MPIRPATPADLTGLRDLHLANWRAAYRGLLPDAALDRAAADHLDTRWGAETLSRDTVLVSQDDAGRLAGFVALREDGEGGVFVDNLHVAAAARGRGHARALMAEVARRADARPVWLLVLDGNAGARAVYRRWGGTESAPFEAGFLGLTVRDRRVDWPSGRQLARALAGGAAA